MRLTRILANTGLVCIGLGIVYALIVLVLLVRTPVGMEEWFRPKVSRHFSEAAWRATKFGDPNRYRMANDLVRSGRLLGKTTQEVKDLLGQESSEDQLGTKTLIGYDLVSQRQFPAKCFLLPSFLFLNTDTWLLEVQVEYGKVNKVKIRFT